MRNCLQVNKSACDTSVDANRRRTPSSETGLYGHNTARVRTSAYLLLVSLSPNPSEQCKWSQVDVCPHSGMSSRRGASAKRTRVSFVGLLLRCLPSTLEEKSPSSRAACYTNIQEEIGQNKGQIVSHSQDTRNVRDPWRIVSQRGWHCLTQCLVA